MHILFKYSLDVITRAGNAMLNLCFGAPAFNARLIPVNKLKADFVFDQLNNLINCIHGSGGYVFAVMANNLKLNQKCFRLFREKYSSDSIFSIRHPVSNHNFVSPL